MLKIGSGSQYPYSALPPHNLPYPALQMTGAQTFFFDLGLLLELQCAKTNLLTCEPNVDSNQPANLHSLMTVFIFCMKKLHLWLSKMRPVKNLIRFRKSYPNLQWAHVRRPVC